jgi:hypothetical protein
LEVFQSREAGGKVVVASELLVELGDAIPDVR